MISSVHHINFVVRDLDLAVERYRTTLGLPEFIFDSLESRAVKTARIKLGETWLVLVQPIDEESIPAKHLQTHGEGFFLISLGTDDIDTHLDQIASQGCDMQLSAKRQGLENWTVADLPVEPFSGSQFQLTQEITKK